MSRSLKWALIISGWMACALIATEFSYSLRQSIGKPMPWLQLARIQFTAYVIWAFVLTPLTLEMCRRFPIESKRWPRAIAIHTIASIGVAVLNASLRLPLHHFVYPESREAVSFMLFRSYFWANGFDDIWMYWVVVVVNHVFRYYSGFKDRELRTSLLQMQLARAELQALRTQLHPHFLFNTLHSISALVHEDAHGADRMISRLSDLLRMTLETGASQVVTLRSELEFLESYLDIEKTRFQDRLLVRMQIDPSALDAFVPHMILQPIVENAVRHGIAKRSGPGTVEIAAARRDGSLVLMVRDDGPGLADESALGKGLGLGNTRARLEVMYGGGQSFVVRRPLEGGFEVAIRIPWTATSEEIPFAVEGNHELVSASNE